MKRITLLTAVVIIALAASCGQNAQNQTPVEQTEKTQQEVEQTMTDEQFYELLMEIYYKLPETVMPHYLKTDAQRRKVYVEKYNNRISADNIDFDSMYERWHMAGYLTEDNSNVVLLVMYGGGYEGFSTMSLDKTFNYNLKTGELKEIERPIDPFTADEMIDENNFDDPQLAAKAKAYYNENKNFLFYQDFNKDGFEVSASLEIFYDGNIADYLDRENDEGLNNVKVSRKWNGSRFVKGDRWYLNDGKWVLYKN